MKKILAHIGIGAWILSFTVPFIMKINGEINLPMGQILMPLIIPIVALVLSDIISEYIVPMLKK